MTFAPDRLSVAPMMDWTDRHFRFMMRQITKRTLLYTEMVTAQAVVFGDAERLLAFNPEEKPLILQLGGADPDLLAKACRIAAPMGFDGVNLNTGCPSERVSAGCFGAALRKDPNLIAECLSAMKENSPVPVSVKSRIALEEDTPDVPAHAGAWRKGGTRRMQNVYHSCQKSKAEGLYAEAKPRTSRFGL